MYEYCQTCLLNPLPSRPNLESQVSSTHEIGAWHAMLACVDRVSHLTHELKQISR